jgi:hypothetical protein
MKQIPAILVLGVASLGLQDPESRSASRPESRAERPASFPWAADARAAIRRVRESKSESMNVRLWEANAWIAPIFAKARGEDVEAFLDAEEFKRWDRSPDDSRPWRDYQITTSFYVVQERAITLGKNLSFDWVLVLAKRKRTDPTKDALHDSPCLVAVDLVATCCANAATVFTGAAVPNGSALYKALDTEPAQKALAQSCQLDRIFLGCWPATSRCDPLSSGPMEMTVTLEYGIDAGCVAFGQSLTISMPSGLGPFPNESDPATTRIDRRDTLGPLRRE